MPVPPILALLLALAAPAAPPAAEEQRRIPAAEAEQGVAADRRFVYAIGDSAIAKYDKASGRRVAAWRGDPALFPHLNSCAVVGPRLVCAASNYPATPMTGAVELFDKRSLRHIGTHSIGQGPGSLTVIDWHAGSWWAIFANYDGRGGMPGRDHRATTLVRMDQDFVARESWLFPDSVLERFAPRSCSGASWGADGLLYVTGHDRAESYALRLPEGGSILTHVATIGLPTGGQAIDWDPGEGRSLWSIDRAARQLVVSRLPAVAAPARR